jgi:hydroxypyruvate isomerase
MSTKLKFCANLTTMYTEATSLLDRYSLAKASGFKGVECAFPYDYSKEDLAEVKDKLGLEQVLINTDPGIFVCIFKEI